MPLMTLRGYLTAIETILNKLKEVQGDIDTAIDALKSQTISADQIHGWVKEELALLDSLDRGPLSQFERVIKLVKRRPEIEAKHKNLLDALRDLQPTIKNIKKAVNAQDTALENNNIDNFLANYEAQKDFERTYVNEVNKKGHVKVSAAKKIFVTFTAAALMVISMGCSLLEQTRAIPVSPTAKVRKAEARWKRYVNDYKKGITAGEYKKGKYYGVGAEDAAVGPSMARESAAHNARINLAMKKYGPNTRSWKSIYANVTYYQVGGKIYAVVIER